MENIEVKVPINLTKGALEELEKIKSTENIPQDYKLRVGVKGGGCSGFSYILGFDSASEHDQVFELGGLSIVVDKSHLLYLAGLEIDYVDGLNNRGFSFNNPNAEETCGCGTSFSA